MLGYVSSQSAMNSLEMFLKPVSKCRDVVEWRTRFQEKTVLLK